jgi:hypothetical protein
MDWHRCTNSTASVLPALHKTTPLASDARAESSCRLRIFLGWSTSSRSSGQYSGSESTQTPDPFPPPDALAGCGKTQFIHNVPLEPSILASISTEQQGAQKGCPARPQWARQAEVEVKVEQRSDSFFLSLDLSLNLPKSWRTFSASC